jgi:hypothetical protein
VRILFLINSKQGFIQATLKLKFANLFVWNAKKDIIFLKTPLKFVNWFRFLYLIVKYREFNNLIFILWGYFSKIMSSYPLMLHYMIIVVMLVKEDFSEVRMNYSVIILIVDQRFLPVNDVS